jgi:hypothetical protein
MRSASLLFLSAFSLVSQIYAAPAPGANGVLQERDTNADDRCLSENPRCSCDGGASFCGYVDSDWHTPAKPIETTTNVPVRKPKMPTATDPEVVIVEDPLSAALFDLHGSHELREQSNDIIWNHFSPETRGQFVTGLRGYRDHPFKTRGKQFNATRGVDVPGGGSAYWALYWDFSWYGPGGALPKSGIFGPHVVLYVQLNGQFSHTLYYPPAESLAATAARPGDYYFDQVLDPLRQLAGLNTTIPGDFEDPEIAGGFRPPIGNPRDVALQWLSYY